MLGTYKVVGTAATNTCGAALGAPNPWNFSVQLSESGATLYWSWMDGTPALSTTLSATNAAHLTNDESGNVDPTDAGLGPCTMSRDDEVLITLAAGSPPATFVGTVSYTFTVPAGSVCADQYSSAGGMFDTLPCTVSYTATGTRQN